MDTLHNAFVKAVTAEAAARGFANPTGDEFMEVARDFAPKFGEMTAEILLPSVKKDARKELKWSQRWREGFEKRLGKRWAEPLQLLELLVELAHEFGDDVITDREPVEQGLRDYTFEALVAIHARGCQMSRAILALLRSGFADDAHARWRSLHELAVISSFISEHRETDIAERYLLYEIVQQRKLALAYKKHEMRANLETLPRAQLDELNDLRKSLIDRFGKPFGRDWGWAASALGKDRPTFVDIEADVKLDHYRPDYQMANNNVHGNSHAAFFKLGLGEIDSTVLLAGPSSLGLAEAGQTVALSLTLITAAVCGAYPTVNRLIGVTALNLLQQETGEAFLRAHEEAEKMALYQIQKPDRFRAITGGRVGSNLLEGIRNKFF